MKDIELFDKVYSDGFMLTGLINILSDKSIERKSFDFTSLASDVIFGTAKNKIVFCGGSKDDICYFKKHLGTHPEQQWIFLDGYNGKSNLLNSIREFEPKVVVLSLGSGLQEEYALKIKKNFGDKKMQVYTSGAFISQTAIRRDYYPALIESLNLRWAFRALNNSHVRERLFKDYPRNFARIIFDSGFRQKVLGIVT